MRKRVCLSLVVCLFTLVGCGGNATDNVDGIEQDEKGATPDHAVLLFGGLNEGGKSLGDTWVWDGPGWKQKAIHGPDARFGAAATTLAGEVVLFGGFAGQHGDAGDTWIWDGSHWTQKNVHGPGPREIAQMGSLGKSVVLYGGYHGSTLFDTWVWNGTSWSGRPGATGPAAGVGWATATLDNEVAFLGDSTNSFWTWNGSKWNKAASTNEVPARACARAARLGANVVLFGGVLASDDLTSTNDTWIFDGKRWSQVVTKHKPKPRACAGLASLGNRVVLFGGFDGEAGSNGETFGDTWTFDGNDWSEHTGPGPSARSSVVMVAY
jgi:hypothetical protein